MNYLRISQLHQALAAEFATGATDPQPPIDPPIDPHPPIDPPEPPTGPYKFVQLTWDNSFSWKSQDNGGFSCTDVLVFGLSVPVGATGSQKLAVSEYGNPPYARQMVLSRVPGTFDPADTLEQSPGTTVSITVPASTYAGHTVYFNVRNWSRDIAGGLSCTPGSSCNVIANYLGV